MAVAHLHPAFDHFGGGRVAVLSGADPEHGTAHAAGGRGRGDHVARCRPLRRGHPAATAPALQPQARIHHAGGAIAAELVQAQFRVLAQQQPRIVGERQGDAGVGTGADVAADGQAHALARCRGRLAIGADIDLAAHRHDARRRGLHPQPGDGKPQHLARWQAVGVGHRVVVPQLFPGHGGLEIARAQVPQGVAGAHAIVPVLGAGRGRARQRQRRQRDLQQHGQAQPTPVERHHRQ